MNLSKLFTALMLVGSLSACGPDNVKTGDAGAQSKLPKNNAESAQTGSLQNADSNNGKYILAGNIAYDKAAINDANNVLIEKVIYFEYDSDQISADYQELIAHHGKYLTENTDMNLRLEGHADERGSREYNVALANRRAQSVRRLILFQGVNTSQVTVISYGEEKPVALGHDNDAWQLNRRVELVYEAK